MIHRRFGTLYIFVILCGYLVTGSVSSAQENGRGFSLIFGWNTAGEIGLLAREATAVSRLRTEDSIVLSFGALLGPTRIVQYDDGAQYLAAARQAGIEYVIPTVPEFMFGVENFRSFSESEMVPRFISANIVDEKTRKPLVDPYVVWEAAGRRICLIPLSDMQTIREAPDANVVGIDVLTYDEALDAVSGSVAREAADFVLVAGRLDRAAIQDMAVHYPLIDAFVTNHQSGGFADGGVTTTMVQIEGKPVYVGSEAPDHLGFLRIQGARGVQSWEFADVILGDEYPPDAAVAEPLNATMDMLKKQDYEESMIDRVGSEVASVLRKKHAVDVVLLERQSLYYYPLEDSLSVLNVRRIVKPGQRLVTLFLRGNLLKSIWEESRSQTFTDLSLVYAGMTAEGKVDSIPIMDDRDYVLLTTDFLHGGGNGYNQFTKSTGATPVQDEMLAIVEEFLVAKEERLRKLAKPKIWELNLYLTFNTNYTRTQPDEDVKLYGGSVQKELKEMVDLYAGNFIVSSQDNKLTMNKVIGKHEFNNYLEFSWSRQGTKNQERDKIQYNAQRNHDPVELYNKYTYNIPAWPVKPFTDLKVNTFLYSGFGPHPISGTMSTGATRTFPRLLGLNVAVGLHGTRDFRKPENSFGTSSTLLLNKKFPPKLFFSIPTELSSTTHIYWNPVAKYHMEFKLDHKSIIRIQLYKKINGTFKFMAYSYRSTVHRKLAVGTYYYFTIDYGMHWKF